MKTILDRKWLVRAGVPLALVLTAAVWATNPAGARLAEPSAGMGDMDGMMKQRCTELMAKKARFMADIKSQDAALTTEVAAMNAAPVERKSELLAAVVTHMVEQKSAMDARMAAMQDEMMKHMMEHMQPGKEGMSDCPMMKGMMDGHMKMDGKGAENHMDHHADPK